MRTLSVAVVPFVLVAFTGATSAHITVGSGPGFADKTQKITFNVGHGCEVGANHFDTWKVQVVIPAGVTSVRPIAFGAFKPTIARDQNNVVTSVTWEKAPGDILAGDDEFYELTLRANIPAGTAFSTTNWEIHQSCKDGNNPTIVADWTAPQTVVPQRKVGWNKFTLTTAVAMADMGKYFGDALIVWKGTSAFSSDMATTTLIANTPGVTALTSLASGDEIWVKY